MGAITVPALSLTAGASRIDANGVFQHPSNDLQQGRPSAANVEFQSGTACAISVTG